MDQIKIIRLKNGEDIICYVYTDDNYYFDICEPMTVDIEQRGQYAGHLIMANWLPVTLIKDNRTTLKSEDILTMFDPDDKFCTHYIDMVSKLRSMIEAKNKVKEMTNDEITEIFNAMEGLKSNVLH